ncbi:MAG: hypothetical protein ABH951_00840 [Patescibacteria group bacterium]
MANLEKFSRPIKKDGIRKELEEGVLLHESFKYDYEDEIEWMFDTYQEIMLYWLSQ